MAELAIPRLPSHIKVERAECVRPIGLPTMHYHLFYEIYTLASGKRRYFIGDKIYDVYPGDVIVIPVAEVHRTSALDDKGFDRFVIYFDQQVADSLIASVGEEAFGEFINSGCLSLSKRDIDTVTGAIADMMREEKAPRPHSDAVVRNLLEKIIMLIMRNGEKKERNDKEGADKIQEVTRYVNQNFKSQISLKDAAGLAFMEKTYFSKKFKQLTGFGFKEYLTLIRLREAESLLRDTTLSVSEISEACGFAGSNYFGDAFKKEKGVSPSEFRKNIKQNIRQP